MGSSDVERENFGVMMVANQKLRRLCNAVAYEDSL